MAQTPLHDRMRNSVQLGIILAIVITGLGFGAWYLQHPDRHGPPFQTARVSRGELTQAVTASGQLNPVINVLVGSQISGTIQKLFVDFNSPVQTGQVLAQIDDATYVASVDQAEGDLSNAKAALELVQIVLTRNKELRRQNLVPQNDLYQF